MAPASQEKSNVLALVGSSLLFGLLMQSLKRLLALMESANKAPFCLSGYDASGIKWVVPVPGGPILVS
ncbi:hypothetical protein CFR71_15255 [Novacetimonas pomaceti]|uniref:Uncharacterized protein n=1 Tax=Novacetimonas pomaceti TaxID=2021998 RepID=A0A318QAF9_9PROT|nr:hypothetical protein CFR71_15255 [Novacetimonas pomaceti]